MTPTDPQPSPTAPRPAGLIGRTLRRHRLGILVAWVIGTLAACGVARLTIHPKYRAVFLLRVDPETTELIQVRGGADNLEPYVQTQVQLFTSPNVLAVAARNPEVAVLERIQKADDVVLELRKAVTVSILPGTYLIEVGMISESGPEAATVVNAVVGAYLEAQSEWTFGMTRQQIKNLEQYQVDLKNQIDDLVRRWKALVAMEDRDLPPQGAGRKSEPDPDLVTIEEYRTIRRELNAVDLELSQARAWLATAREINQQIDSEIARARGREKVARQVDRRVKFDPEVATLADEVSEAEAKLNGARRQVKLVSDDPAVVAAKRKRDGLVARYNELKEAKSTAFRGQLEDNSPEEQEVRDADASVRKLQARQAALKAKFENLKILNRSRATDAVEITMIQDERKLVVEMQATVARRLEQLRFDAKKEQRVRPVNPNGAMVPTRPFSDKRMAVFLGAPFLALFASLAFFIGAEAVAGSGPATPKPTPLREV